MKNFYKIAIAACFMVGMQQEASAQLSVLTTGNYNGWAVSNNGIAAFSNNAGEVYKWDNVNGIVAVGKITNGKTIQGHPSISDDGTKISATITNPANNLNEAAVYTVATNSWVYLGGLLPNGSAGFKSSAWGISGDGTTTVGLSFISSYLAHAIQWNGTTMVDLGSMVPDSSSRANRISRDKHVVVGWQDEEDGVRSGAKWVDGVESYIKDNDGLNVGEAFAVSNDGKVIAGSLDDSVPYVWIEGEGLTYINSPNMSYNSGSATAISGDGKTVIGFFRQFPGPPSASSGFIWTKTGGLVDLNTYALSLGIDMKGVQITMPLCISEDGKKITGNGLQNGAQVVFYLDLANYLGTNDLKSNNAFSIYPNPVKDVLHINGTGVSHVEIYSVSGQKVNTINSAKDQINVSGLDKGVYILKANVNGKVNTTKFIKE